MRIWPGSQSLDLPVLAFVGSFLCALDIAQCYPSKAKTFDSRLLSIACLQSGVRRKPKRSSVEAMADCCAPALAQLSQMVGELKKKLLG